LYCSGNVGQPNDSKEGTVLLSWCTTREGSN
jgi:hypothetical protein